ncbi:alpha/beta hydrolase [Halolamina pelagica]|uniref:alpha/beta hydrolase n=1 Tax=Halolamina pelagica TaxID=699431 RepID=UPI0006CA6C11|nr:alpha/beta hydrolase [Halolamina pelagica]
MSYARREKPSRYAFSTRRVEFDGRTGHLFTPDRPADAPVVVLAPGAGLPWRAALESTAERLAARGYAVFAFDHRGFGHVDGDHLLSPSRQRADLDAAVEAAREAPEVDGTRLALWGMDLSAGTALAAATDSLAVDAVIARFPVLSGATVLPAWVRPRLGGSLGASRTTPPPRWIGSAASTPTSGGCGCHCSASPTRSRPSPPTAPRAPSATCSAASPEPRPPARS